MTSTKFQDYGASAYKCSLCGAYAKQHLFVTAKVTKNVHGINVKVLIDDGAISECEYIK